MLGQKKAEITPRNHTKFRHTEHLIGLQGLMVKTAPWLKDLRGTVKRTYGPGWVLEERSGWFKIQRREVGNARAGKRPTISTKIRFAPSSSTELLVLIGELTRRMADLGLGLYAAHELINGAADDASSGGTNWEEVVKRYEASRIGTGHVKAATYDREERRRIERTIELIKAKGRGAANDGPGVMRNYTAKHLADLKLGGVGRKRALLDVCRFLRFAVIKCGAERIWLPLEGDDLQDLIGLAETRKEDKVPVKPDQLFGLIDSLYEKPELKLAVTLVGLFGLRPAELKAMTVVDGKLKVANVKRNRATAKTPKPDRIAYPLEIPELPGAAGQAVAQLNSGLVKLPIGIVNATDFKICGHTFRQYLDRHPYWAALVKANPGLSPYSLRHGYAYRGALAGIPLRQLAASMGHDVRTHMKHYGQWTDAEGLEKAFAAANASVHAENASKTPVNTLLARSTTLSGS
jgi:integrase